jgi:anthranilate/para-aminobenzoate synthase component I
MKFEPRVFGSTRSLSIGEIVCRLRGRRGLVALDSAGGAPRHFSWVAFDPLRGLELPHELGGLRAFAAELESATSSSVPGPFQGGFLGALSYDLGVHGERAIDTALDPWRSPRMLGGLYTDFIVRDESTGATWLVLGEAPGDDRANVAERRREIESALAESPASHDRRDSSASLGAPDGSDPFGAHASHGALVRPSEASLRPSEASLRSSEASLRSSEASLRSTAPLVRHTSAAEHCARIERARELIAAGEFYQVNLAHRFTRAMQGDPVELYRRLRAVNPAPYMAYFAWDADNASGAEAFPSGALLSASPELLFELDQGIARTRPIKGTAARAATKRADDRAARALLASEKDKAELAMIVDLERNDLGRIARPGCVRVERMPHLESYANVHHMSADVVAELRAGVDAFDVLASLFPGGSVTGAPKLASMHAIRALEGEGRGFFTGSAGFVDTRGSARFNILIRTLVWRPSEAPSSPSVRGSAAPIAPFTRRGEAPLAELTRGDERSSSAPSRDDASTSMRGDVSFHVGSGITWSSNAGDEDRETLAKGRALEAALESDDAARDALVPARAARSGARRS